MFGVRIGMMMMPMVMRVIVGMIVGMAMRLVVGMVMRVVMGVVHIQTTGTSTKTITEIAILDIASRRGNALPFDMMMVAFLRKPNLCLKPQYLRPVFTQRTIHIVAALQNFPHTISESSNDL